MSEIIDLKKFKEDNSPHLAGEARCLNCAYKWIAVVPIGTLWLECPSCSLKRGRYFERVQNDGAHRRCQCGCDLFYVTPDGYYCPNCGMPDRF